MHVFILSERSCLTTSKMPYPYSPLPFQPDRKRHKKTKINIHHTRLIAHSVVAIVSGILSFFLGIFSLVDVATKPGPAKVADYRLVTGCMLVSAGIISVMSGGLVFSIMWIRWKDNNISTYQKCPEGTLISVYDIDDEINTPSSPARFESINMFDPDYFLLP